MIDLRRAITVRRSPEDLYWLWRDLKRLPSILDQIESIESSNGESHWIAHVGPLRMQWDAEVIADEPCRRIAWQTQADSDWTHHGEVLLRPAPGDRGTEVHVHLRVEPRGVQALLRMTPLLRKHGRIRLGKELRRFKQWAETGEIATAATRPTEPTWALPEPEATREARA
jgi:uncharacterized membrane protein